MINKSAIAKALGVNRSMVTRWGRAGMPLHSVEAAAQWRAGHVRLRSPPPPNDPPARPGRLLATVNQLADATDPADVEALRGAIALLPPAMRPRVRLAVGTWKLLLGPQVLADLAAEVPADPPVDDDVVGAALCLAIVAPLRHA